MIEQDTLPLAEGFAEQPRCVTWAVDYVETSSEFEERIIAIIDR